MEEAVEKLRGEILREEAEGYEHRLFEAQVHLHLDSIKAQDLATIARQMDIVILEVHRKKIEEINHIIDDYWKAIYTGDDIETIRLKAVMDGSGNKS